MKRIFSKVFLALTLSLLLVCLSVSCSKDSDSPEGYGMCVNQSNGFHCFDAKCEKMLDNHAFVQASGTEVFSCLGVTLIAPSTMTISFEYKAYAWSCWNYPYLLVTAGDRNQKFSFYCDSSGNGYVSIEVVAGTTLDDIILGLFSGDWGSAIRIKDITFTPLQN